MSNKIDFNKFVVPDHLKKAKKSEDNPIDKGFAKSNVVLLTGPGGTGKTYSINEYCNRHGMLNIARTATTGLAATHISGNTINRFAGIGANKNPESIQKIKNSKWWTFTERRLQDTDLVIIDEASMLRGDSLQLIDLVFKHALYSEEPFGGMRVLMSGDFLQLPPVDKQESGDMLPDLFGTQWAFASKAWAEAGVTTIELTEIKRQDDKEFIEALMHIRRGECPDWVDDMLKSRVDAEFASPIQPITFVSTNWEADKINRVNLSKLSGEPVKFDAAIQCEHKSVYAQIMRDSAVPKELYLKVGAQVMFLKNDPEGRFVNGSMGIVKEFGKDDSGNQFVVVETADGQNVNVYRHEWERLNHKDDVVGKMIQIPLKPAYAVTIHKSQGMSLDRAEVDCGKIFAPGQAYVALSRVRSLDGLKLKNWNRSCVFADEEALKFYENI